MIVTTACAFPLIPRFGAEGAAGASAIGYGAGAVAAWLARRARSRAPRAGSERRKRPGHAESCLAERRRRKRWTGHPFRTSRAWSGSCSCSWGSSASSPASRRTSTTASSSPATTATRSCSASSASASSTTSCTACSGSPGLALSSTWNGARTYLIGGGAVYATLWLLGILGGADWIPSNNADNWLHLVLGAGMIAAGVITTRGRAVAAT